jgi:hypothetical protein
MIILIIWLKLYFLVGQGIYRKMCTYYTTSVVLHFYILPYLAKPAWFNDRLFRSPMFHTKTSIIYPVITEPSLPICFLSIFLSNDHRIFNIASGSLDALGHSELLRSKSA